MSFNGADSFENHESQIHEASDFLGTTEDFLGNGEDERDDEDVDDEDFLGSAEENRGDQDEDVHDEDWLGNAEDEGDQNVDEYGFQNFHPEEVGDLSTDDEEPDRWAKAGFTDGLVPAAFEIALLPGTTFSTWAEFDAAVNEYEALSGFRFSRTKKKLHAARGVCRGWQKGNEDACKVEISARCMKKSGLITIRKVFLIHTCSNVIYKFRSGGNKTAWVARKVANHFF